MDYKWYLAQNKCENEEQENGSLVALFQESTPVNTRIMRKMVLHYLYAQ